MHGPAILVLERGDDLACSRVDDFARGRIGERTIDAESNPARLVADPNAGDLPGRHRRGVEDMEAPIERVAKPKFSPIRRQADAMARATMHRYRPFLKS